VNGDVVSPMGSHRKIVCGHGFAVRDMCMRSTQCELESVRYCAERWNGAERCRLLRGAIPRTTTGLKTEAVADLLLLPPRVATKFCGLLGTAMEISGLWDPSLEIELA
jgi:hypothetical protein